MSASWKWARCGRTGTASNSTTCCATCTCTRAPRRSKRHPPRHAGAARYLRGRGRQGPVSYFAQQPAQQRHQVQPAWRHRRDGCWRRRRRHCHLGARQRHRHGPGRRRPRHGKILPRRRDGRTGPRRPWPRPVPGQADRRTAPRSTDPWKRAGTRFHLRHPPEQNAGTGRRSKRFMSKRTILIVDDEAHVIRVLRLMLERSGYLVISAADGNEALAKMADRRPDAMVSDIQMAGMDGRELCRTVRARYADEPFLILVMTSMTASDEREWVRQLANIEFLEKPLSPRQLVARLALNFPVTPTSPEPLHVNWCVERIRLHPVCPLAAPHHRHRLRLGRHRCRRRRAIYQPRRQHPARPRPGAGRRRLCLAMQRRRHAAPRSRTGHAAVHADRRPRFSRRALARLFDQEFADKKPTPTTRYADFVVSGVGQDDSVDGPAKIKRFKKEEFPQILVSVNMLDTGFDCPEVRNLVMARYTNSSILYRQMRGRGTRLAPGKDRFTMWDFTGVTLRHGDDETPGRRRPRCRARRPINRPPARPRTAASDARRTWRNRSRWHANGSPSMKLAMLLWMSMRPAAEALGEAHSRLGWAARAVQLRSVARAASRQGADQGECLRELTVFDSWRFDAIRRCRWTAAFERARAVFGGDERNSNASSSSMNVRLCSALHRARHDAKSGGDAKLRQTEKPVN